MFGSKVWAEAAGLWHDIGKYSEEFQKRIGREGEAQSESRAGRVDHSTAGAQHAVESLGEIGKPIAYAIAGHHSGLANWFDTTESHLKGRLKRAVPDWSAAPTKETAAPTITPKGFPFKPDEKRLGMQAFLFVKMLFSALVDADFLDTERFLDEKRAIDRQSPWSLSLMKERLESFLYDLELKSAGDREANRDLNRLRNEIRESALREAPRSPGMYRMTVPTGGGKTLSSLAFALDHALENGLSRILYVIPFTSIIEQNAGVFRNVFGEIDGLSPVLEHHSNYDSTGEHEWNRLAAENWDAPLVVTTNVQFFESLFDYRTSRNRKLHNIASSVIILDEAQSLPPGLLKPTLRVMEELADTYRCSFLFCTATQPAITWRDDFPDGIKDVLEIAPDVPRLFSALKRTNVSFVGEISDVDLAAHIVQHDQVLVIVNTRRHAHSLYESVTAGDTTGVYHLSALMYPVHRQRVLRSVRRRLENQEPVRLISTQLIEAGVDIDFPVVYRSVAGVDSLAQAGGRCNREGKLKEPGSVVVFEPVDAPVPRQFRRQVEIARRVLERFGDPLLPEAVEEYFQELYWRESLHKRLDSAGIVDEKLSPDKVARFEIPFREISESYRLINNAMHTVVIVREPDHEDTAAVRAMLHELEYALSGKKTLRSLQRYSVQVYDYTLRELHKDGALSEPKPGVYVLNNPRAYSESTGLVEIDSGIRDPLQLMS